ncbi:MAG: hypothetical protein N2200_04560 [Bacteroidia bacterium]|nr:hypothetical protein [Bacteroidia bacterium]
MSSYAVNIIRISLGLLVAVYIMQAQNVGIGTATPDGSARLDVEDANRGILIPRVALQSETDATTILRPAHSLLVYNTNASLTCGKGYYYNAGTPTDPRWMPLGESTIWYHRYSTNALSFNSSSGPECDTIPGLSQQIEVPKGYEAYIEIWADIYTSFGNVFSCVDYPFSGTNAHTCLYDVEVRRDNTSLAPFGGGLHRNHAIFGSRTNTSSLSSFLVNEVLIARDHITATGTYTYAVRVCKEGCQNLLGSGGAVTYNYCQTFGGHCSAHLGTYTCSQLKLAVRYIPAP